MRLLVACPQCQRQYDAAGRGVGGRFRCHCGEVITIAEPKAHDAAVVRCSSCGAPRSEGSLSCTFCEADFTLHERDLHTVCPNCMARVSDRASFCHYCGTKLMPESVAGDDTPRICPACRGEYRLGSRRIAEVNLLECGRCAGFWLGSESFNQLTQRAGTGAPSPDTRFGPKSVRPPTAEIPVPQGSRYRNCPVCGKLMHRRNYGRRSGVIIDVCKNDGIWFDADELPRILDWIRSGGLAEADRQREAETARQQNLKNIEQTMALRKVGMVQQSRNPGKENVFDVLAEFVAWMVKE